jgi:imidazolonepropionase-like amidohydrolase
VISKANSLFLSKIKFHKIMRKTFILKKYHICYLFLFLASTAIAQNPMPAKPQTKAIALVGATIHTGNGSVIERGIVVFDKGIITAVGDASTTFDRAKTEVIDIAGKHLYPGLIAMGSTTGLVEIGAVRATVDNQEIGALNPNVRALIAYNTDSEVIPTLRNNGLLLTQVTPQGGTISGMSSVMELDGWNWEDAVLKKDDGMWLTWPPFFAREFNFDDFSVSMQRNSRRQEVINSLHQLFADAKAYFQITNGTATNLKLEALRGLFNGSRSLFIRADNNKDIIESVKFAKQYGVQKVVIVGAEDALRVMDFLKENKVAVVLNETHRLPNRQDEPVYTPYQLPALLHKAGVTVALSYGSEYWRTRNLPFVAGTAVGFSNLDKEEALKMITSTPAKLLGIDQWVGTIEKGKQATLVVSKGDLLDMRFNGIEHAFIKGRKTDLDDRQKRQYRKYSDKYEILESK